MFSYFSSLNNNTYFCILCFPPNITSSQCCARVQYGSHQSNVPIYILIKNWPHQPHFKGWTATCGSQFPGWTAQLWVFNLWLFQPRLSKFKYANRSHHLQRKALCPHLRDLLTKLNLDGLPRTWDSPLSFQPPLFPCSRTPRQATLVWHRTRQASPSGLCP